MFSQLQQSEEARESEMTDLNKLTEEFTKRISDAEKRLQQAAKVPDLSQVIFLFFACKMTIA